jgi:hypothetical protein
MTGNKNLLKYLFELALFATLAFGLFATGLGISGLGFNQWHAGQGG